MKNEIGDFSSTCNGQHSNFKFKFWRENKSVQVNILKAWTLPEFIT